MGVASTYTYTYDSNENVESDTRSGIAFMVYDINNLPVAVYTTGGVSQTHAYDVNGARLRKYTSSGTDIYYLNDPTGRTEVVLPGSGGGLVYTYNITGLDAVGQLKRTGSRQFYSWYYYLKDHLGSVRVIVNSTGVVDSYNDFYPYGMLMPGRSSSTSADARFKLRSQSNFMNETEIPPLFGGIHW